MNNPTNPSPYIDLEEIEEFDSRYKVQEKLRDGWVYLGMKTTRTVYDKGDFTDDVTYILGKPRKK